jgi:hypothetical protein
VFVVVAARRCPFRVADLLVLAEILYGRGGGKARVVVDSG